MIARLVENAALRLIARADYAAVRWLARRIDYIPRRTAVWLLEQLAERVVGAKLEITELP